jgi:acid stress-induced BolA-like protein IbaG/YrbA
VHDRNAGRVIRESFIIAAPSPYLGLLTMSPHQVEQLIRTGMPNAQVQVDSDDSTHFSAVIVSDNFTGKRTLQRHQLVYATLGKLMGNEIHALTMQTHTAAEWQALQSAQQ